MSKPALHLRKGMKNISVCGKDSYALDNTETSGWYWTSTVDSMSVYPSRINNFDYCIICFGLKLEQCPKCNCEKLKYKGEQYCPKCE